MNLSKKVVMTLLFGIIALSLLYSSNTFVGNTITVGQLDEEICSGENVGATWQEAFVETFIGVQVSKNDQKNCTEYIAFKTTPVDEGIGVYFVYSNLATAPSGKKNLWSLKGYEGRYQAELRKDTTFEYFEGTPDIEEKIQEKQSFQEKKEFFLSYAKGKGTGYKQWSVQNEATAQEKFNQLFIWAMEQPFSSKGDHFGTVDLTVTNNKENTSVNATYEEIYAFKDKASIGIHQIIGQYKKISQITLTKKIPSFTFKKNSKQNYAFTFSDHFKDVEEAEGLGILFRDQKNSKGQYLNYTINGSNVTFTPKKNFTGSMRFIAYTIDKSNSRTYSNQFIVSIAASANKAPILTKPIAPITLTKGQNSKITLRGHFTEPEGERMTYRSVGSQNSQISFIGDVAVVSARQPFNTIEQIRIYASDSTLETASNIFLVRYIGKDQNKTKEELEQTPNINDYGVNPNIRGGMNNTQNNLETPNNKKDVTWILILLIILLVTGFVGLLIWLYLKHQKQKVEVTKQTNQISENQVATYINELPK